MTSRVISLRACTRLTSAAHAGKHRPSSIIRFKSSRPDPQKFLDTANELFVSLRWKAANALTASLSPGEREQLLERLSPRKPDEIDAASVEIETTTAAHTIAEAVAAAQAKEAQLQEGKWETMKESIYEEARKAAEARVESDLAIQKSRLEKMKQEFEQEKEKLAGASAAAEEKKVAEVEVVQDVDVHPILGPVVANLGYKRIHRLSAKALSDIPVWEKQRVYRHGRAKKMAEDKMKSLHLGMPGIIGLHEDPQGKLSIIDGQHRVGMMAILKSKDTSGQVDWNDIVVEVYPQQPHHTDTHAQEIFVEVNKAEPVRLVDMPGVAKSADRKIITSVAEKLEATYPDMFSPSQNCRSPHLNIDNLRDALFGSDILKRHSFKSAKALEAWIMEQNEQLAAKFQNEDASKNAALKKATKHGFYLGLEPNWLYQ